MGPIDILKFPVSSPADTSPLQRLQEAGYAPSQILGVVGKSEGNGCVNDFSRTLSTVVWDPLIPKDAVTIFSGGTEGVLSPHITFIVKERKPTGIEAAVGRTRELKPQEIGTATQAGQVAATVKKMMSEIGVSKENVHLVLIKCPLLTSSKIEMIRGAGEIPITADTYESMAKSRFASAVGVAVALGEIRSDEMEAAVKEEESWSAIASCSSGAELEDCHILLLASASTPARLRAVSSYMTDAIDATTILKLLSTVKEEGGKVVQVFAKAEADPTGLIRGSRHTMSTDSDIQSTRHARAAVGGLLAGLISDTQIYVSGGAEGQGPPGGGGLTIIYRVETP